MILVPRTLPASPSSGTAHLRYQDQHGHSEIVFDDVRVPAANLVAARRRFRHRPGAARPRRIHHAMRAIGMAERALP